MLPETHWRGLATSWNHRSPPSATAVHVPLNPPSEKPPVKRSETFRGVGRHRVPESSSWRPDPEDAAAHAQQV